ncbi:hypothetical protein [Levilactobacillus huananensis]|uniref:hypothetical protein n=1 Tax=Levilactobacillus huananensis TaxID=2486019 RepID=UPI000F79BC5B|nr:hypothetical protein [Levilactobacillus huananensis]
MSTNNFELDSHDLTTIAIEAEKILNHENLGNTSSLNNVHSAKSNSPLDKKVKKIVKDTLPQQDSDDSVYLFEAIPWLAAISASNTLVGGREEPALKNRYTVLKNKNESLTKIVDIQNDKFGYETIHHSQAYHYSQNLIHGNKHIGESVLGEIVTTLNGTAEIPNYMEQTTKSIDLLNVLLEQFAVTNSFNTANNVSSVLDRVETDNSFSNVQSLKFENRFPSNLETEVKNLIQQLYADHPFTKEGIALYLKPLLVQRGLSSTPPTSNPSTKSAVSSTQKEHSALNIHQGIELFAGVKNEQLGTKIITKTIDNFNTINSRSIKSAQLKSQINSYKGLSAKSTHITIEDFLNYDINNVSLVKRVDNIKQIDTASITQLFVALDTFLTCALLKSTQVKTTTYPLQRVTNALKKFDNQIDAGTLDASTFSTELSQALTDDSNKIIDYFKQWNENFADLPNSDLDKIKETVAKIRPIINQLNQATNHTSDWENIINN